MGEDNVFASIYAGVYLGGGRSGAGDRNRTWWRVWAGVPASVSAGFAVIGTGVVVMNGGVEV